MGCVVTEAESGRAALAILEQNTPCDLMVTDLVMPGLSGLDTLRLARRDRRDLKVLFVSGYADLSRFGDNLSNQPLLKKPLKLETLAEAVQTALQAISSNEPDNVVLLRRDQR
jgi:two-component system cell cycle sensor histidine kinase/response regulator CckA